MLAAPSLRLPVEEESQVGEARRAAKRLALEHGLDEVLAERAAIVASEAARNVLLHASGGELLLRPVAYGGARGVELLALDRGPGIHDVGRALADGYSTAGTAGQGLGAIQRLASEVDLYTRPGAGTALLARVWEGPPPRCVAGAVCVAVRGETRCGDAWAVEETAGGLAAMVADGLGHGPLAADAAEAAREAFQGAAALGAREVVERAHLALRATRGAAIGVVAARGEEAEFCGVGNVSGVVLSEPPRRMVSSSGTVGHEVRRTQVFGYGWPAEAPLVLHSDGVATRWNLADYPGLDRRDPALLAGVLYRDFSRGRDDATVLALRRAA